MVFHLIDPSIRGFSVSVERSYCRITYNKFDASGDGWARNSEDATCESCLFWAHLEEMCKAVEEWPDWKRESFLPKEEG